MPRMVSLYICYSPLHVPLQYISTYSAIFFVRDIHFVLFRRRPEELEENNTKEGRGEVA